MTKITASAVKELREVTGSGMMDCKKALIECNGDFEASKEFLRKKGQLIASKRSGKETNEGAICISLKNNKAALIKVGCETDFVARNDQFLSFTEKLAEYMLEAGMENFAEQESVKNMFNEIISTMGENILYMDGVFWKIPEGHIVNSYTHTNRKIGVLVELKTDLPADDTEKQLSVCKDIAMHIAASEVEAVSENDLAPAILEKERKFLTEQASESGKPENIVSKMVEGRMSKFKKEICLLNQPFVKEPDKTVEQYLNECGRELDTEFTVVRFYKNKF